MLNKFLIKAVTGYILVIIYAQRVSVSGDDQSQIWLAHKQFPLT